MQLSERARALRHRVAEIVGGLTGPQDYELDGAILAAFEELRAAAEAAAYARAAQVADLTRELYRLYRIGPIDLRYSNGAWFVLLPLGNAMMVVDGSKADTPERALENTITAWQRRSPDRPFGWSPPDET